MRDDQLLHRARQGDAACLDELVRRLYPGVLRYCACHTREAQTAEDAAQETFLRFVRHLHRYAHTGRLKSYLYTIAANVCTDLWRKHTALPLGEEAELPFFETGFAAAEADADCLRLLAGLPAAQREVLLLRFSQDLTLREVAETLGIPLRTAQSRLRTALANLRAQLP